jgi:hypothetical protein
VGEWGAWRAGGIAELPIFDKQCKGPNGSKELIRPGMVGLTAAQQQQPTWPALHNLVGNPFCRASDTPSLEPGQHGGIIHIPSLVPSHPPPYPLTCCPCSPPRAGPFIVFNEPNEAALLRKWFQHMREVGRL